MKKYLNSMPTVAFFSVAYFCFSWLQVNGLQEFDLSPMASILFLPAGVKFLAMLVGGLWGVLGIAVGKICVEQYLGNDISLTEEITHLLVWLIFPYACLRLYLKKKNLKYSLDGITTYDLVVLSVLVSFISSIATQLYFFGLSNPESPLLKGIWSMTMGDLSGILLMFGLIIVAKRCIPSINKG